MPSGRFLVSLVAALAGYAILVGSVWGWAAVHQTAPPLWPVSLAGGLVTLGLFALWGVRGLAWSLAIGVAPPLLVWLFATAQALVLDGGQSDESRFTIWAGLVMGVGLVTAAWLLGALPGGAVGQVVRTAHRLPLRAVRSKGQ